MNEERMKVLEMVADGTISADDAAKLLDALNESGAKHRFHAPHPPKPPRHGAFHGVFHSMGDMMGEVMKEMRVGFGREDVPSEAVEAQSLDEDIPSGASVRVKSSGFKLCGTSGSVKVTRSASGRLVARPAAGETLRVLRDGDDIQLYINAGGVELEVPEAAGSLELTLKAGSISVNDLHCPLRARTMGGSVHLVRPGAHFSVKTMGGGLELVLGPEWNGGSKAKTMGGGVSVELLKGFSGTVDASTMGGSVEATGVRVIEDKPSPGSSRKVVAMGEDEGSSILVVKTMGGGVSIRGGEDV